MQSKAIIVPARLGSQRFPRKLLFPIGGKPLLLHTAHRLREVAPDWPLHFAVAEEELATCLRAEGFSCVLTDPNLPSGTDRLAAANRIIGSELVLNVQADEPFVTRRQIDLLAQIGAREDVSLGTLATPFASAEDFCDSNKVKVVCDLKGRALYFSRSPIPFRRDAPAGAAEFPEALWHLGLYAYKASYLEAFAALPPGRLEQLEKLEQLRALENGHSIAVGLTEDRGFGIDTPEDVAAFASQLPPESL
jgi:3-deoxy-manno-octulosonate cytidylyltransferase (CMP-KDO synthetase)